MIPVNSQIIIKPKSSAEATKSGIILVKEGIDQDVLGFGAVHAACKDSEFKKGQDVFFNQYVPVEFKIKDEIYYAMSEKEIVCIL